MWKESRFKPYSSDLGEDFTINISNVNGSCISFCDDCACGLDRQRNTQAMGKIVHCPQRDNTQCTLTLDQANCHCVNSPVTTCGNNQFCPFIRSLFRQSLTSIF